MIYFPKVSKVNKITSIFTFAMQRLSIHIFYLVIICASVMHSNIYAQNNNSRQQDGYRVGIKVVDNDTLYVDRIAPVYIFNHEKGRKSKNWRDYYRTVWNFKKVYPYALKAKEIIREADSTLQFSKFTKKEKDRYLKEYQKRLFKEFEKPLKNLSINQGKLLLRLLDRELGQTSFYIIKNYRGGAAAGFWQGIAKLFGSDLKRPYDRFGEDKEVEELVHMYHLGTFDYLYYSMFRE